MAHFSKVAPEYMRSLLAESCPQLLHERLTKEDEALLATVLEEDLEVVLL